MSAGLWVLAGALGGLGALARFAVDGAVIRHAGERFWLGILSVNATGAFALGVLAGTAPSPTVMRLVGTAALGAYTTFSTWMLQARRLNEERRRGELVLVLALTLAAGLLAVWAGRAVGRALAT